MTTELRLRNADLAWRTVDDEMIAIDVRESTYLTANDSGALLWNALASGTTRERACGQPGRRLRHRRGDRGSRRRAIPDRAARAGAPG